MNTHASDGSEHITPLLLPASTSLSIVHHHKQITKTFKPLALLEHFLRQYFYFFLNRCRVQRWSCALHTSHHLSIRTQTQATQYLVQQRASQYHCIKTNKQTTKTTHSLQNACPLRDPNPLPPRERGPRTPGLRLPEAIRVHPQAGSHPGSHRAALLRGLHVIKLVNLVLAELRLPEDDALQEISGCYLSGWGDATCFRRR